MLVEKLASTKVANKLFVEWYNKANWQLTIPIADFFKLHFRYQVGIFEDFIASMNIGIAVNPKGFFLYVIDTSVVTEDMYFVSHVNEGLYLLGSQEVDLPNNVKQNTAAIITMIKIAAIVEAMKIINSIKNTIQK